jgi:transcriptional regulator with XRE-family HTH domain
MTRPREIPYPYPYPRQPLGWQLARLGWQRKQFAAELGIHSSSLSAIITGRAYASAALRARIAERLGLPEADLFVPEPERAAAAAPAGRAAS